MEGSNKGSPKGGLSFFEFPFSFCSEPGTLEALGENTETRYKNTGQSRILNASSVAVKADFTNSLGDLCIPESPVLRNYLC